MRKVGSVLGVAFLGMFCLSAATATAEDFRVEASVNAKRIGLDDDLELTVSIHGDVTGRAGAPELPPLEGFRVAGRSQSTNIQWINGQMSASRSFIYTLIPESEGDHVIGPVSVEYRGKQYTTEPIEVEVVPGSVQPRTRPRGGGGSPWMDPFDMLSPFDRRRREPADRGEVFVSASLSKPRVYVGEQVILTYRLYTQVQIMGLEVDQLPPFTGFWVEEIQLPKEPQWKETEVDGKPFHAVVVKKRILFPTKPGKVTIEPARFSLAVRASADLFDSFLMRSAETLRRSTRPLTLEVKPLPSAGRPRDFTGAVGQFKLAASLDKEQTPAGEPLTLTVELKGKGNLRTVEAPAMPPVVGFRTYDPEVKESLTAKPSGLTGTKQWEYVLVPDAAGLQQLGPFTFSYFDPAQQRYKELKAGPLTVDVAPAPTVAGAAAATARGEVKLLRRDVRYLKQAPENFGTPTTPYYRSLPFYGTLALPILWNLGLMAYRWKRESEAAQEGLWRRRRAHKMAQTRLKHAAKMARSASKEFYEETAGALYRYVADKLGVSPSGLTTRGIDAMLEKEQVPSPMRSEYLETIETCEFARFTPGERSREEMEALLARAERAIVSLERHLG
ncbi:MAG: BatD family protein [Acidobacteriota bacterium]